MTIYLEEAHAEDEWPIGSDIKILAHKTIEDRAAAVKKLEEETGYYVPTLLDSIDNQFNNLFKAWPIRFYLIQNGVLVWTAMPKDGMFSSAEVEDELNKLLNSELEVVEEDYEEDDEEGEKGEEEVADIEADE